MAKMSAYKAHEARMWIKEVIVPVATTAIFGLMAFSDPDTRRDAKELLIRTKDNIHDKAAVLWYKITKK